jgi:hypothetical protein
MTGLPNSDRDTTHISMPPRNMSRIGSLAVAGWTTSRWASARDRSAEALRGEWSMLTGTTPCCARDTLSPMVEISLEEGRQILDATARRYLNMSGGEFMAAWDEDRIPDPDSWQVQQVASLLPFAR